MLGGGRRATWAVPAASDHRKRTVILAPGPSRNSARISEIAPEGVMRINAFGAKSVEPAEATCPDADEIPERKISPDQKSPSREGANLDETTAVQHRSR